MAGVAFLSSAKEAELVTSLGFLPGEGVDDFFELGWWYTLVSIYTCLVLTWFSVGGPHSIDSSTGS